MKRIAILTITLLIWFPSLQDVRAQSGSDLGPQPPGQFDFYVLSLTWVPGFCTTHRDAQECSRNLGFQLHGLWPESINGYPSACSSEHLPAHVRKVYAGLFPSSRMIGHEWSTHGTCTGLGPAGFFALTKQLLDSIHVPADYQYGARLRPDEAEAIKSAFIDANPGLTADGVVLVCQRRRVSEIHICLTKDGDFRDCEAWEQAEDRCR